MKQTKVLTTFAALSALALLPGCGDSSNGNSDSNSNSIAPRTVAGKTLTVQVTSGTPVFMDHGFYTFMSDNNEATSGTYHITGDGNIPSNIGTFTYRVTGNNTAELDEVEQSGTVVQNTLTFDTPTSGTISSYIPSGANPNGGRQTGTFTLQ
ncbi:MAG TPA: hypothetical protein VGE41_02590 [Verrucomicrobiae bacterium]|jgi:hypothetical protein